MYRILHRILKTRSTSKSVPLHDMVNGISYKVTHDACGMLTYTSYYIMMLYTYIHILVHTLRPHLHKRIIMHYINNVQYHCHCIYLMLFNII